MTQTHSATVATGGATKVSLPTDDLDELLETAAVTVESGGNPTWLSGSGSESLGETTADRRETARRLDTTVSFTVSVLPADAPDPIPDLVAQFESGDLPVAEMSTETLHANLDAHDVTEYRLTGALSSSGDVRFREFAAFYETPWGVRDAPVADFEGEDDRLVLSHREVVENVPESMYLTAELGTTPTGRPSQPSRRTRGTSESSCGPPSLKGRSPMGGGRIPTHHMTSRSYSMTRT
jgi:hypothetical protein